METSTAEMSWIAFGSCWVPIWVATIPNPCPMLDATADCSQETFVLIKDVVEIWNGQKSHAIGTVASAQDQTQQTRSTSEFGTFPDSYFRFSGYRFISLTPCQWSASFDFTGDFPAGSCFWVGRLLAICGRHPHLPALETRKQTYTPRPKLLQNYFDVTYCLNRLF